MSSIAIYYITHDRTAELRLPAIESERFEIDEASLLAAVRSIPPVERPRSLRSASPDLKWLKRSLTIETDAESGELVLSISSNRATQKQLAKLLDEIALFGQPAAIMVSSSIIYQDPSLDERVVQALEIVDEMFDSENDSAKSSGAVLKQR